VSDPKQRDLDSVGRAASWLRERSKDPDPIPLGRARDRQDWRAQGKPDETVAHLRPVEPRDWQVHRQSDVFAEAVARAMQEQGEPDLVEVPSVLQNRHAFVSIAARFAGAMGASALVALVFVAAFPASQNPADEDGLASLPALKSLRSSLLPAPQRKPDPSLVIRDGGGPVNQRLSLGVNVKSPDPDPGRQRRNRAFQPCRANATTAATAHTIPGTSRCRARGAAGPGDQSQRSRRFRQAGAGSAGDRRSAGGALVAASRSPGPRCPRRPVTGEEFRSDCVEATRHGRCGA
jgi:hypothetical protein